MSTAPIGTARSSETAWVDSLPQFLGDSWVAELEPRKQEEARFHDADRAGHADEGSDAGNRRFYQAAAPANAYVRSRAASLARNAVCLDYACGNGLPTLDMVRDGAVLAVGIDISAVSVRNATESAAKQGLSDRARFLQRDCENTGLPDRTFDFVFCSGMLHHLDLGRAYPELARIVKPGGRVLCFEALAHNPIIQMYRDRTPQYRTEWESKHILRVQDAQRASDYGFTPTDIRYFCMASPVATLLPSGPIRKAGIAVAHAIDSVLTRTPLVQRWAWMFVFELVKR